MAEIVSEAELERRCRSLRVALIARDFAELRADDVRALAAEKADADRLAVAVTGDPTLVAALRCVDYVCVLKPAEVVALRERLARPVAGAAAEDGERRERTLVSSHADRLVFDEGDRFVKEFSTRRARDTELKLLWKLKAIDIHIPQVLATPGNTIVTARLPGEPLDELIRRRWAAMPRAERSRFISRVASVCRRIRDAGFAWPDLVTYHVWIGDERISVLDPARLRRGRLDLSALFWSTEEPTVGRADRLRFWRAYAGRQPPPRLRRIGHRGRFRPYRWFRQALAPRSCPPWSDFVNAVGAPFASAAEIAERMTVKRTLKDRVNGELEDLVVKITTDPEVAKREWQNHRMMMASGFRVPQPAVGGMLADGRALFSTRHLKDLHPMDQVWSTLDRRRAVRAVADVARRLHACGLVHRDLYLNHLFVERGGDQITIIDLGRLEKSTARRQRVKDLAALLLSARPLCTRTELWRGFLRYDGDRRLARAVIRKAARLARHVPRRVRDGSHSIAPCTSA